jgi:hypothetical protein
VFKGKEVFYKNNEFKSLIERREDRTNESARLFHAAENDLLINSQVGLSMNQESPKSLPTSYKPIFVLEKKELSIDDVRDYVKDKEQKFTLKSGLYSGEISAKRAEVMLEGS